MKKTILFLLAFVTMGGASKAQTITVADVEALPGETVAFSVDLTGGKDTKYTAFQFDVQFPATGFTTTGAYTVSPSWTGASATVGSVDGIGLATVPFASANEIQGTDVEGLVTVSFKVDEGVALGNYDVTLKNIFLAYNTSDKDYPADVAFKVNVVSAHSVILDETSTVVPEAATGVNVTVKRTINAGEWSTICLPFAMPEAQVKVAFGDDVQLGDFTGYTPTFDNDIVKAITVNFNKVTAMEANHPYIIKVSSAITEFTVDGLTIDPQEAKVSFGTTTGSGKNKVYHPVDFIGTYVADFDFYNDATSYPLFLNANKFYYATENTKHMKAFRAYFDFDDYMPEAEPASAPIYMSFENETTGIRNINMAGESDSYYDLQGRRVETPSKGLYIKNGKKVVIK